MYFNIQGSGDEGLKKPAEIADRFEQQNFMAMNDVDALHRSAVQYNRTF
jgi:hypothetical protein